MLQLGLVLLVATSALAAPTSDLVNVRQYYFGEVGPAVNDGRISYLIQRLWDQVDGGDVNVNVHNQMNILNDMANTDRRGLAFGQALAMLGELITGYNGDACAAYSAIQAYNSGSPAAIRQGVNNFIRRVANNIELIVSYIVNPASTKFARGPTSGCQADGRVYDFERAWDIILSNTVPSVDGLMREEYCVAKRLYSGVTSRTNNVGAVITASALPAVRNVFNLAGQEMANLFEVIARGGNPVSAAQIAQRALINAASRIN